MHVEFIIMRPFLSKRLSVNSAVLTFITVKSYLNGISISS